MSPALEVSALRRSFGGLRAVNDVSFAVSAGQVKSVIGPNGAGKTTLFNLISGLLAPEAGAIRKEGRDITRLTELDRIKSEFVNTVSHDLRTPLTSILGYVELIERMGSLTDQQHEFVERVQGSVHNITTLINDLLELGRIEAGFDTRKEIVDLEELVRFSVEELHSALVERSQEFILEIRPFGSLAYPGSQAT